MSETSSTAACSRLRRSATATASRSRMRAGQEIAALHQRVARADAPRRHRIRHPGPRARTRTGRREGPHPRSGESRDREPFPAPARGHDRIDRDERAASRHPARPEAHRRASHRASRTRSSRRMARSGLQGSSPTRQRIWRGLRPERNPPELCHRGARRRARARVHGRRHTSHGRAAPLPREPHHRSASRNRPTRHGHPTPSWVAGKGVDPRAKPGDDGGDALER